MACGLHHNIQFINMCQGFIVDVDQRQIDRGRRKQKRRKERIERHRGEERNPSEENNFIPLLSTYTFLLPVFRISNFAPSLSPSSLYSRSFHSTCSCDGFLENKKVFAYEYRNRKKSLKHTTHISTPDVKMNTHSTTNVRSTTTPPPPSSTSTTITTTITIPPRLSGIFPF